MVVLRTFDNYFSANILLTRLQDAGVECFLFDENTVTMGPILSNAIGRIKLVTRKENAVAANELLKSFDREYMQNAICPLCGSSDFIQIPKKETKNMLTAMLTWIFSSYAIAPDQVYHCRKCGYENEELPQTTVADN